MSPGCTLLISDDRLRYSGSKEIQAEDVDWNRDRLLDVVNIAINHSVS